MEREDIIKLELSNDVLVHVHWETNSRQNFHINVNINSLDVADVAPPTVEIGDVEHHAQ